MKKANTILDLFEGLNKDQAKTLTDRIYPTLERVRAEIINPSSNGNGTNQQEKNTMNVNDENEENDIAGLTPDEAQELRAEIQAATRRVIAKRTETATQGKIEKYKADMLAARGKRHILAQIRQRAAADGVPVDSIIFG